MKLLDRFLNLKKEQWAAWHHAVVSLLIVAYFTFGVSWLWLKAPEQLSPPYPVAKVLAANLSPLAHLTGLEQYWGLFSPECRSENLYNLALVTFHNGLLKLVELPRMEKLNLLEKLQKEKYRKLFNDNMPTAFCAFIRPDIARSIARANNEPGNTPDRVVFFMISNPILPPGVVSLSKAGVPASGPTHIEKYFVYGVSRDDL